MKRGLTLIELIVAIILTGIVTWMTLSLFSTENKSYNRTRERVRLQADSREALRVIEQEIRNLGYKTVAAISANRVHASISSCSDAKIAPATGDSSSFTFGNSNGLAGDSLSFLFHEIQNGPLNSCSNLRTIGFRQSGSLLQRRWCNGACTAEPWIPLLDSVVTFQLRYGLIAMPQDTSSQNGSTQLRTATRWTQGALTKSGTSPDVTLSGFTTARQTAIYGFAIDSMDPRETWEVRFTSTANDALLSEMDTTSFKVGFYNANGTVSAPQDTTGFIVGIVSGVSRNVVVRLSPGAAAYGTKFLGIEGKLKSATRSAWNLTLSNISMRRVSRGRYIWVEAPTVAQKNMVKAVDIHLLVKARKTTEEASPGPFNAASLGQSGLTYTPTGPDVNRSFVLFQRIVPVVNNGP